MRIRYMFPSDVDAAVEGKIESGCCTFARLCDVFNVSNNDQNGRIIDRALQRLRRAGRIKYENHKWVRVS